MRNALLTISSITLTFNLLAETPIATCKECGTPPPPVAECKDCQAPNGAPTVPGSTVKTERIVDGWLQGKYPKVETGPYFSGDFAQVMGNAKKSGKLIILSVGRDQCPNTTRFYHYMETGMIDLDPSKVTYVKLNGDRDEDKELFGTYFENSEIIFPFVGVMNGYGATFGYRNGYGTSDAFNSFFANAFAAADKWKAERAAWKKESGK